MGKKTRTGVLKRQREVKKAEKAAMKREKRAQRETETVATGQQVATNDDLAGYGFEVDQPLERDREPPARAPRHPRQAPTRPLAERATHRDPWPKNR